jgi:hypothetical protein
MQQRLVQIRSIAIDTFNLEGHQDLNLEPTDYGFPSIPVSRPHHRSSELVDFSCRP